MSIVLLNLEIGPPAERVTGITPHKFARAALSCFSKSTRKSIRPPLESRHGHQTA